MKTPILLDLPRAAKLSGLSKRHFYRLIGELQIKTFTLDRGSRACGGRMKLYITGVDFERFQKRREA